MMSRPWTAGQDVLLVAPHADDVALSMGAAARLLCTGASVRLVTVFAQTGLPECGARRREDAEYAAAIGAAHTWCDITEAALRRAIRQGGLPARLTMLRLARTVARRLRALAPPRAVVFGPLAIGGHVDHLLVRQAVLGLRRRHPVVLYEDQPYATSLTPASVEACARRLDRAIRRVDVEVGAMLEAKRADCALYRSQRLVRLWPALRAYAEGHDEGRPVERFWTW